MIYVLFIKFSNEQAKTYIIINFQEKGISSFTLVIYLVLMVSIDDN